MTDGENGAARKWSRSCFSRLRASETLRIAAFTTTVAFLASACGPADPVAEAKQPLEATNLLPPTKYNVSLRVKNVYWASQTVYDDVVKLYLPLNLLGALGVSVNGDAWQSTACSYGGSTQASQFQPPVFSIENCASQIPGTAVGQNSFSFGSAGAPLTRTFEITRTDDRVYLGAALDNVGPITDLSPVGTEFAQAGLAFGTVGNALQGVSAAISIVAGAASAWLGAIGAGLALVGGILAAMPAVDERSAPSAQDQCLGGILGNPPGVPYVFPGNAVRLSDLKIAPEDSVNVTLSGQQIIDGTQNGPLIMDVKTQMSYQDPDSRNQACFANTTVEFVIDRVADTSTGRWTNGPAWQPRSADSGVVRRPNAVEHFRLEPQYSQIGHMTYEYAQPETTLHPTDGLAACNGPASCVPLYLTEYIDVSVGTYIASTTDPQKQHPPTLTNGKAKIVAVSPDPTSVALFFVDDAGGLYTSVGSYGSSDKGTWKTWLLTSALPPDAPLAALRAFRSTRTYSTPSPYAYNVFYVGSDGQIYQALVDTASPGGNTSPQALAVATNARPGAAIAAVARSPQSSDTLNEVFVVGDSIWHLSGSPSVSWSAARIAPSTGNVAPDSPLAVVATTANNLDVFYLDNGSHLKHSAWTTSYPADSWSDDASIANVVASTRAGLSAVSRTPNNIDVAYPCNGNGLCDLSISNANSYPGIIPEQTPALTTPSQQPWFPITQFSIVAPSSFAVDLVGVSGALFSDWYAYDWSWQHGASSWGYQDAFLGTQ